LFIYPKNDRYVSAGQVKRMSAASKKAGGKPEELFIDDGANIEERMLVEKYKAIEAFLAKHLGPGATAAGPASGATPAAGAVDKK